MIAQSLPWILSKLKASNIVVQGMLNRIEYQTPEFEKFCERYSQRLRCDDCSCLSGTQTFMHKDGHEFLSSLKFTETHTDQRLCAVP